MKTHLTIATIIGILAASQPSRAQEATSMLPDTHHAISLEAGMDSAIAMGIGYTYRWSASFWKHDILPYGKFAFPVAGIDLADSLLEAGLRTTLLAHGNLRLQASLGALLRNTSNRLFSANSIGLQATLLPGYQSSRWGAMAEIGYEKMFATNLRHSDLYKETFYSEAKSGWYSDTAGTFRFGGRAGVRIAMVHLSLRMGTLLSEGGNLHLPPFYATIGAAYAF